MIKRINKTIEVCGLCEKELVDAGKETYQHDQAWLEKCWFCRESFCSNHLNPRDLYFVGNEFSFCPTCKQLDKVKTAIALAEAERNKIISLVKEMLGRP